MDTLTIYFLEPFIPATELVVFMEFSANLQTEEKFGFYQTTYVNQNGETKYVGATQFKQYHARQAFPHYDEPEHKTPFELSITHDPSQSALSNTPGTSVVK